jgi:hypothetical protein
MGNILVRAVKPADYEQWLPLWDGYNAFYGRSGATARNFDIEIDPDRVVLGSIFDFVSFPMDTTDGFHTYRGEATGTTAKLYVDDVLRLQMQMDADNTMPEFWFGDQGWESGEIYWDYVRYGTIPEPTTAALLVGGLPLVVRRRRT